MFLIAVPGFFERVLQGDALAIIQLVVVFSFFVLISILVGGIKKTVPFKAIIGLFVVLVVLGLIYQPDLLGEYFVQITSWMRDMWTRATQ